MPVSEFGAVRAREGKAASVESARVIVAITELGIEQSDDSARAPGTVDDVEDPLENRGGPENCIPREGAWSKKCPIRAG